MGNTPTAVEYIDFVSEWRDSGNHISAHTSGSTGTPKEIRLLKSDMRRSAACAARMFGLDESCVVASALPFSSIATKMAVVRHLVAGCRYAEIAPSNELRLPPHVDLLSVGPSQALYLLEHPELARRIKHLLVGGAPMSAQLRQGLIRCGYDVYESYGMTETCSNVALRHGNDDYFTANDGISFDLDPRGCLIVRAPEYSFDGTVTNDLAELISPEKFRWLGRFDNMINSGGIKIFPEMLEKELAAYIGVPFYIIGRPDPKWGTAVVMVVEGDDIAAEEARKALSSFPDRVRCPKDVVAIRHFQHTSTGKVRRIMP